jgi:hypothetical protein
MQFRSIVGTSMKTNLLIFVIFSRSRLPQLPAISGLCGMHRLCPLLLSNHADLACKTSRADWILLDRPLTSGSAFDEVVYS